MPWETRQSGGRYYTRSRKVNGRIVREYVGTGIVAELAYQQDQAVRAERRHLRAVKMLATVRKMALPTLIDIKADIQITENKANSQQPENRFAIPANSFN